MPVSTIPVSKPADILHWGPTAIVAVGARSAAFGRSTECEAQRQTVREVHRSLKEGSNETEEAVEANASRALADGRSSQEPPRLA